MEHSTEKLGLVINGCLYAEFSCGCVELFILDCRNIVWHCDELQTCTYGTYRDEALKYAQSVMDNRVLQLGRVV